MSWLRVKGTLISGDRHRVQEDHPPNHHQHGRRLHERHRRRVHGSRSDMILRVVNFRSFHVLGRDPRDGATRPERRFVLRRSATANQTDEVPARGRVANAPGCDPTTANSSVSSCLMDEALGTLPARLRPFVSSQGVQLQQYVTERRT
jgi:hypothetical protein